MLFSNSFCIGAFNLFTFCSADSFIVSCPAEFDSKLDTEYGNVSGNNPGGGFSPIFIKPTDGLRFAAKKKEKRI